METKKQKAIVYLRKSTDREDKQQISIETQRQYCLRLAEKNNIDTFLIEEHKSAKEELKRPGFKQMLSLCKKWNYDYVIAYDPTRISRNTIDAAHFTELINKSHIKWFYAAESGQFFNGADIFSALMLWISFLISKVDNQMRSSNTRKKMETYFMEWRLMGSAPFWYKNHQFFNENGRLEKDIIIIDKEAELVRHAFKMRKEGAFLRDISDYFKSNWYNKNTGWIDLILKNTFYIWIQKWKLWEAEIKMPWYKPLISCQLFEEINNITPKIKRTKKIDYNAPFKWLLYNADGIKLLAYETKNKYWDKYIYYRNLSHIDNKINISQNKLFKKIEEYIKENYNFNIENINIFEKELKKEFFTKNETKNEKFFINDELKKIDDYKKVLTEKLISGIIDDDTYRNMILSYMKQKKILEEKLSSIIDDSKNINTLIRKWVELLRNGYFISKNEDIFKKITILKKLKVELFLNSDYSLKIKENIVLNLSKNFLSWYGIPDKDRTCVCPLGGDCSSTELRGHNRRKSKNVK